MKKENIRAYSMGICQILTRCGVKQLIRFLSDYSALKKQLTQDLAPIVKRYMVDSPGVSFQKYLDIDYWLFENMRRCYMLGLHTIGRKLKILDVGTGAAYFPFVCKYYGHDVEVIDVADNEMYNDIVNSFGLKKYTQYIRKFNNLSTNSKYDLVTAFMICFNCHQQPDLWHVGEWDHFLTSLHMNNLNSGGRVFLSFNAESAEEPVSKELLAYFAANNAEVAGSEVYLNNNYIFER